MRLAPTTLPTHHPVSGVDPRTNLPRYVELGAVPRDLTGQPSLDVAVTLVLHLTGIGTVFCSSQLYWLRAGSADITCTVSRRHRKDPIVLRVLFYTAYSLISTRRRYHQFSSCRLLVENTSSSKESSSSPELCSFLYCCKTSRSSERRGPSFPAIQPLHEQPE